jgi:hypothetical protein
MVRKHRRRTPRSRRKAGCTWLRPGPGRWGRAPRPSAAGRPRELPARSSTRWGATQRFDLGHAGGNQRIGVVRARRGPGDVGLAERSDVDGQHEVVVLAEPALAGVPPGEQLGKTIGVGRARYRARRLVDVQGNAPGGGHRHRVHGENLAAPEQHEPVGSAAGARHGLERRVLWGQGAEERARARHREHLAQRVGDHPLPRSARGWARGPLATARARHADERCRQGKDRDARHDEHC